MTDPMREKCFACGKALGEREPLLVDTRDAQTVYVGPECGRKILAAGEAGYQPPRGGPRLYPLPTKPKLNLRPTVQLTVIERAVVAYHDSDRDAVESALRDHGWHFKQVGPNRIGLQEATVERQCKNVDVRETARELAEVLK